MAEFRGRAKPGTGLLACQTLVAAGNRVGVDPTRLPVHFSLPTAAWQGLTLQPRFRRLPGSGRAGP